ncbi:MAG: hypothetical protein QE271_08170 [Bacteriovoracaceae bacterium]|nr:hypothetical protein [Bacteriovoracaceae bacterium]
MNKTSFIYILVLGLSCLNSYAKHGALYFCAKENLADNATTKAAQFSFFTDSKYHKKNETRKSAKSLGLNFCLIGSKSGSYFYPISQAQSKGWNSHFPSSQDSQYVEVYKEDVLKALNNLDTKAGQLAFIGELNLSYQELCDKYRKANVYDAEIKFIKSDRFYNKKVLVPFVSTGTQTMNSVN